MKLFYELLFPSYFRMSVAAAVAGSAVVGAAASSAASSKAAKAQSGAANAANGLSQAQYEQTRSDNMPYLQNGVAGSNQLAFLLGLSPTKGSATPSLGNAQLVGPGGTKNDWLYQNNDAYRQAWDKTASLHYGAYGKNYSAGSDISWIENQLRQQLAPDIAADKARLAQETADSANDPAYGSLTRKFSQNDLNNDVVYNTGLQFGLDQGTQGINRQAAASGNMLSGATLKALTRFGNDYGTTKANDSYNRFTNDQNNLYNRYAGLASNGQVATQQVSSAGQSNALNQGNNLMGAANARGASAISGANAFNNALGTGVNAYQQQNLLNSFGNNSAFDNANGYNSQMAYMNSQLG